MIIEQLRDAASHSGWRKRVLLGSAYGCGLAAIMAIDLAIGLVNAEAKVRHEPASKAAAANKGPFGDIPKGPIEIFVSIDQQKLHLYSDGAHIADTSVATGVPSLPTPLGVFSVIQKQVFHRSNIYSGAPMPFMQRITWSGVALHEGESIGHRASHGCIRMPGEFARRLYALTKIGARVIVANAELKPTEFSDPHLFVHKVPAPPPAAPAVVMAPAKDAPARRDSKPAAVAEAPTAEASAAALPGGPAPQMAAADAPKTAPAAADTKPAETAADIETKPDAAASSVVQSTGDAAELEPAHATSSASDNATSAEAAPAAKTETPPESQSAAVAQSNQSVQPAQAATDSVPAKPAQSSAPAQTAQAPAPPVARAPALPVAQQPSSALVAAVQIQRDSLRGTDASPTVLIDVLNSAVPVPANKPVDAVELPADKKTPIAIFVSRKTQRIYVRQNFEPMFDAAITIDHPEQPIGTHVFTALSYLDDGSTFRWDVVSMPGAKPKVKRTEPREIIAYDRYGRPHRQRVAEKPAGDPPPPQTPADALARIQIPPDIIDRIAAMILPGSSLIISDQGLGEETGEGTDFVVVTSKS